MKLKFLAIHKRRNSARKFQKICIKISYKSILKNLKGVLDREFGSNDENALDFIKIGILNLRNISKF